MGNVNISESHILVFEWTAAAAATYQDFNSRPTLQIENRGKSKQEEFFFQSCDRQQKQKKSPTHAYTKSRKTTVSRKNNREKSKPPLSEKNIYRQTIEMWSKKFSILFFQSGPKAPKIIITEKPGNLPLVNHKKIKWKKSVSQHFVPIHEDWRLNITIVSIKPTPWFPHI